MNDNDFNIKAKIIKETFNDERRIKCRTPKHERELDENVYPGGDIFTTEEGEFIDFEFQIKDFDEVELTKYVEFAENLYEKHQKKVSVYILCPKDINVTVKECPIKSDAEFTIKLACNQEDLCHMILRVIKNKIKNHEGLTGEDFHVLANLPVKCAKKDRNYFRLEYFRIINRYFY
ncbi:MAG: hypothetical protein IJ258_09055 [Methanobrevibacter sp.]|uniref:hypothetical protein n=1 Tax=Methanobrevibacter sp. TaxID=66852 RepID=UPI0025F9DBAC|nr:hypothetical protein [Methanobrevibacter sp.]MBQ8018234.1 hypothetical protein [Methanobrevibacter sp.]